MCEEYGSVYYPPCKGETNRDQTNMHLSMNPTVKRKKESFSKAVSFGNSHQESRPPSSFMELNGSVTKNTCNENIVSENLFTNKYADHLMNENEKYLLSCCRKFGISYEFSPDSES